MSQQTVTTDAGLVVPATAVERKQRALTNAEFKSIKRLVNGLVPAGIVPLLACKECAGALMLTIDDRIVETMKALDADGHLVDRPAGGGRPQLHCRCTTWSVR